MNVLSPEFLGLFLIAVVILTLRVRKKRGPVMLGGKQISITGSRLETYLAKDTPLVCLLADGRFFGDDYQDKTVPALPHVSSCRCELKEIIRRSREMASEKTAGSTKQASDLGLLDNTEARYYRFKLIAHHPDAADSMSSEYGELADNVKVSDSFRKKVSDHLVV